MSVIDAITAYEPYACSVLDPHPVSAKSAPSGMSRFRALWDQQPAGPSPAELAATEMILEALS